MKLKFASKTLSLNLFKIMKVLPVLFSALYLFNSLLGQAPQSIAGKLFEVKEFEIYGNEELGPYVRQGTFSETHVRSYEGEIQDYTSEPFTYIKTGENTATLEIDEGDGRGHPEQNEGIVDK